MKNLLFVFLLVGIGCSPAEKKETTETTSAVTTSLDVKKFNEMISADKDAVLLDVRTPKEVADGMIPGAIVIDFTAPDFAGKISELDKEKTYFVYCKAGGRSSRAIEQMNGVGFKKLYNLEGGYDAWLEDANGTP
jgi:rhodanese-related sulfurtransferase